MWRSAQRELKRVKTDLLNTQLELKSVTSSQQSHGEGTTGILDGHGTDTHAMQGDPEYYGLHLYKLKHAAPDALRRRLAALCRMQRVSPDRLVEESKKHLRQADAVPELHEYIAAVTEACTAARQLLGGKDQARAAPAAAAAAGLPDWTVPETISGMASALVEALEEGTAYRRTLEAVQQAVCHASDASPEDGPSLLQMPDATASLVSAYLGLKKQSQQWAAAEQALQAEVSHGAVGAA